MSRNIETETSSARRGRILNGDQNNDEVEVEEEIEFRDIHAMIPTAPISRRSSNMSVASEATNSSENFTTMSREFNALVLAGSNIAPQNLDRIGEDEEINNSLAIVPDNNPLPDNNESYTQNYTRLVSNNNNNNNSSASGAGVMAGEVGVHLVKKEEVDSKITAWQTAKIAKINNRFKREDAVITGWENEQIDKASTRMKIVERKLEEKRAKAMEKMQNDIAKAHRKAEERRASAEGKRGIKAAKVLHVADLMRAVGRPPAKRSFF
ncbi:remorin 4.1-like [Silene latifolia]|uniref:remorin 4.1-like n=1 Tax=Silene latifolia TaxID=37657 RepID=UPI003D77BF67